MSLCRVCYNMCLKKKNIVEAEKLIFFKIKTVIRIKISKMYLMSICNGWSIFQEGGTKFVP